MSNGYENVVVAKEKDGAIAIVTVNRPKALNALDTQTVVELMQVTTDLEVDDASEGDATDELAPVKPAVQPAEKPAAPSPL